MEQFYCPLCKQEVTRVVFEKITGIWQEKERRLSALKVKERALEERKAKLLKRFAREKKQIADRAQLKLRQTLARKTRAYNESIRQQKLMLSKERTRIEATYRRRLISESNRILAVERARQSHLRLELKQRFETQSRRRIEDANRLLEKDKASFERDKRLQSNRYNQLNKQFIAMQNKNVLEVQKRETKIHQLEEQLKKNETPQVLGLLNEKEMLQELQKRFPTDRFDHTGKGGDIVHHVMSANREIGVMVYELKKVSHFNKEHITQTYNAQQQRNADYALLITNAKRPKDDIGFFVAKGVIVIHPAGAITIISILRDHLIAVSKLQLSSKQRDETVKAVLEYVQSPSFKNGVESIIEQTVELYSSLKKEVKEHVHVWQDRIQRYNDINSKAYFIENKVIKLAMSKDEAKRLPKSTEIIPIELPAEIK